MIPTGGIGQQLDQLKGLSIQELMQRQSVDPQLVYALALQEKQKMEAAKERQAAMGMETSQGTEIEKMEADLASRRAPGVQMAAQRSMPQPQMPQGIAGVPSPNMGAIGRAQGGIIGYAKGDMVEIGAKSKGPIPQMSPEENAMVLKYLEGLKKFDYYDKNPDKVSPEGRQALEQDRRTFEAQFPNSFKQKVNEMMYGPSKGMAMGGEVKKFQAGKEVTLDIAQRPYEYRGKFYDSLGREITEQDFNNEIYLADQYDEYVRSQAGVALPAPAEQSSDRMSNEARLLEDLTRGFDRVNPFVLKEQLQEVADDPRKNSSWGRLLGGALEVGGEALTKTAVDVLGGLGEYGLRTAGDIGYGFGTTGAVGEAVETTSEAAKQQAMELLNADYAAKRDALRAQLEAYGGDISPEARARIEAELAALQESYDVDAAKIQAQEGFASVKERVGDFYRTNIGGEIEPKSEEVEVAGIDELIAVEPTDRQKLGSMVGKDEAVLRKNKKGEPKKDISYIDYIDKLMGIASVLGRGAGASKGYEASRILETTRDLQSAEADRANRLKEQEMLIGARKDIAAEELAALTNATQQEQLITLRDQILRDMADGSGELGSLVQAERERLEKLAKPGLIGRIDPDERANIEKQMADFKATLLNTELQKALIQINQLQNKFKGANELQGIEGTTGIGSYLDLEKQAAT
jgi:hypothetical protein